MLTDIKRKSLQLILLVLVISISVGTFLFVREKSNFHFKEDTFRTGWKDRQTATFLVESIGIDSSGIPHSRVSLRIGKTQVHNIGEYAMDCNLKEPDANSTQDEVAKVSCWFAGSGKDIIVVADGQKYKVKIKDLDEESGDGSYNTVYTFDSTLVDKN